jgi:hypothetical protein
MPDPSPTVMQSDREAAADFILAYWAGGGHEGMHRLAETIRSGHSGGTLTDAFARHREATEQAERAAIVAFLRGETVTDYTDPQYDLGINLADAIEALAHRKDGSDE